MGATVVATREDIEAMENELVDKLASYKKSRGELDEVLGHATTKSIKGELADGIADLYQKKGQVFAQIETELDKAAGYMSDQEDRLRKTISKVEQDLK